MSEVDEPVRLVGIATVRIFRKLEIVVHVDEILINEVSELFGCVPARNIPDENIRSGFLAAQDVLWDDFATSEDLLTVFIFDYHVTMD